MTDSIQRRITALLERAAHHATPEAERAACQEKADKLMIEHKIERALISWERPIEERRKPTTILMDQLNLIDPATMTGSSRDSSEWAVSGMIKSIRGNCLRFAGTRCRVHFFRENNMLGMEEEVEPGTSKLVVVGYDEDVYYGQLVWNMAFQEILRDLYPGWSSELSMDTNVFSMKNAGYSWSQVREVGLRNEAKDHRGPLTESNAGSKLRTAYKRECKRLGLPQELPRLKDPHHWRESYISGFASNLSQRMAAIRQGREEFFSGKNLPALQRDEDAVEDLFNVHFPPPPPITEEEKAKWAEEAKKPRRSKAVRYKAPRTADDSAWRSGVSASNRIDLNNSGQINNKKELA